MYFCTPLMNARQVAFNFGSMLVEMVARDLLVLPDARAVVLIHERRAGDFRQRAGGQTIVLQQLLEPILGLRVASAATGAGERLGINVRHAEIIAIDGYGFGSCHGRAEQESQNHRDDVTGPECSRNAHDMLRRRKRGRPHQARSGRVWRAATCRVSSAASEARILCRLKSRVKPRRGSGGEPV